MADECGALPLGGVSVAASAYSLLMTGACKLTRIGVMEGVRISASTFASPTCTKTDERGATGYVHPFFGYEQPATSPAAISASSSLSESEVLLLSQRSSVRSLVLLRAVSSTNSSSSSSSPQNVSSSSSASSTSSSSSSSSSSSLEKEQRCAAARCNMLRGECACLRGDSLRCRFVVTELLPPAPPLDPLPCRLPCAGGGSVSNPSIWARARCSKLRIHLRSCGTRGRNKPGCMSMGGGGVPCFRPKGSQRPMRFQALIKCGGRDPE
eukprot:jgi/Chrpa1/26547/Chrysochromulina_OHIO_Genome00011498-RA